MNNYTGSEQFAENISVNDVPDDVKGMYCFELLMNNMGETEVKFEILVQKFLLRFGITVKLTDLN